MFFKFKNSSHQKSDQQILDEEKKLILRYKESGDPELAGELFDPYTHMVFGVCMKYLINEDEAKDAVMQVFENMLKDLKSHQIDNFKSWLYIVSKNHCLKIIRRKKLDIKYQDSESSKNNNSFMDYTEALDQKIDGTEELKLGQLKFAISQLKDGQKKCIELFYLEEKSYKETMEITGYNMKQVKSYVQNGKRNLKLLMSK